MSGTYSRAYVEITNICNMNCSFCHGHSRPPRRMSYEEFDKLTDDLVGVTQYLYYHLMGEPLTHPELCDFIRLAGKKGFKSAVTTNGTLIDKLGADLIAAGVYKVSISVHSFEEKNTENNAEKYQNYIEKCLKFADEASKAGVLTVLRLWNNGFDDGRNEDILRRLKDRFADGEWKFSANGARIRHRLHLEYGERFEWPDICGDDRGERVFCYGLADHFGILCDGTVVPCCLDSDGIIRLGNAFEEDIRDILGSERAQKIRDGFALKTACEELCRRCGYARRFKV